MFGETEQLKQKLEEMLTSNDTEWVNTVMVTLNAMYRQFQLDVVRKDFIRLRRSRRMTNLCLGKVIHTENTVWRAPTTVSD